MAEGCLELQDAPDVAVFVLSDSNVLRYSNMLQFLQDVHAVLHLHFPSVIVELLS